MRFNFSSDRISGDVCRQKKTVKELGIDEAGRGPVLGPMILAGVVVPKGKAALLASWGVADSKKFGSRRKGRDRRSLLADKIRRNFAHLVVSISSTTVDRYVRSGSLNVLEQETALRIIDTLPADTVFLDGRNLFGPIAGRGVHAIDGADRSHPCVAAASILAKQVRDEEFERLCAVYKDEYGDVGGRGYPNRITLDFVQWHLERYGMLPPFYRKSYRWKALSMESGNRLR